MPSVHAYIHFEHFEHYLCGEEGSQRDELIPVMPSGSGSPVGHCGAHTSGHGISIFFQAKFLVLAFDFLIFLLPFCHWKIFYNSQPCKWVFIGMYLTYYV